MPREPGALRRYALALASVLGALVLTPAVRDFLEPTPFLLYIFAAVFSAWYGGLGPGALAALLSIAAVFALYVAPPGSPPFEAANVRRLGVFLAAIGLLGWQSESRRRARATLRFLADAGKTLADSLDVEATLKAVVGLAVPRLADAGAVALRDQGDDGATTAAAPDDGALAFLAGSLARGGATIVYPRLTEDVLARLAPDWAGSAALRGLRGKAPIVVPLRARGQTLGVLTLIRTRRWGRWSRADLEVVSELAQRAALALDNARLYGAAVRMKESLTRRAEELAAADRRKDVFLAVLAHEMCGPLSALSNLTEVMRARRDPETDVAWQMMSRQLDVLTRLAEDLLDVARIAQGKVELRRRTADLAGIVADAVTAARPLVEARRHHLVLDLPAEPLWLDADGVRLAQVLINLLSNAAKYTDPGGHIALAATRQGGDVVVSVRDDGRGIAPDLLPHVFDLFSQGEAKSAPGQGGLGLGLALVRRLVELHGGRVEARSEGDGKGSEFRVYLPAGTAPAPSEGEGEGLSSAAGEASAEARRRILVVDDNADAAATLAMFLRMAGHEVRLAHDGPEALRVAEAETPEVVLLDIDLPGMDGYEVGRQLRERPSTHTAMLVALTGFANDDHRRRCREAGFDREMTKPVDPEELRQLVRESAS